VKIDGGLRMKKITARLISLSLACLMMISVFSGCSSKQTKSSVTLNLATVNNPDMQIMQKLTPTFTKETGIKVNYTILAENDIRSKITQDVAIGGNKFDLVTLGTSDNESYGDNGWIVALQPLFDKMSSADKAAYDESDLIQNNLPSYSSTKTGLCSIPFYGESTLLFYRKDLFQAKNLTMPEHPTWDQIYDLAKKLNDPSNGVCGIAIRGLPGYGENMYIFGSIMYAFGAQWFDTNWNSQWNTDSMKNALTFYKKILTDAGEQGPTSDGYTECLNLMATGKTAMWYDASVSGGTLQTADNTVVKDKIGYAYAPKEVKDNNMTIGGWGLAITNSSKNKDAAFKFLTWATSKDYVKLVGTTQGWAKCPSLTRESTYKIADYLNAAPFADISLQSIKLASFSKPALNATPYKGTSLPAIPEYSSFGEKVAQEVAAYVVGQKDLNTVVKDADTICNQAAVDGKYKK
jgi:sorbitol/mannitol transport system substrate-binding protein